MLNIFDVAKKLCINQDYLIPYGYDKAKIDLKINELLKEKVDGKLVLVTAITPTKAGEGKTTTSIALTDGLNNIGIKSLLCLREPSLGPVFGIKGGATGGGKASVIPSEEINLHFTGDMHALTSSINLISAVVDNHIFHGNELHIDPSRILWKRALDMNDRALRKVTVMESEKKGQPRQDEFVITVASELMAILCLSSSLEDFTDRINNILVAYSLENKPIYLKDLKISHAVTKLMKSAINPNLVQTLEGNPVLIHGGPFANIAHGCNSLIATKLALKLAPVVITEAGFAADLGGEKFMDIKSRLGNLNPNLVVMVATIRALKLHGGEPFDELDKEDLSALQIGFANLKQHMENMSKFGVPSVVAINHFATDSDNEIQLLKDLCLKEGYKVAFLDGYLKGSTGSIDLAHLVEKTLKDEDSHYRPLYDLDLSIKDKIEKICKEIYRADGVIYSEQAEKDLQNITELGYSNLPICIAKTPQSFSDDPHLLGVPKNFNITIREIRLSAGAGFIVPLAGNIMTMPGLPKVPAAVKMEDLKI